MAYVIIELMLVVFITYACWQIVRSIREAWAVFRAQEEDYDPYS